MDRMKERRPVRFRDSCLSFLLRGRRNQNAIERAKARIFKELDVVHFIKQQKYFHIAQKALFSKLERRLIARNKVFILGKKYDTDKDSPSSDNLTVGEHELNQLKPRAEYLMREAFQKDRIIVDQSERNDLVEMKSSKHQITIKSIDSPPDPNVSTNKRFIKRGKTSNTREKNFEEVFE